MAAHVKLGQFEGPLDLLLHLITKAELSVSDIAVSEVTGQYLDYMRSLDELDMDGASEFVAMAATLLYIKSRALLPRLGAQEEGEEDPRQVLLRQLREYKIYKEAGENLLALLASGGRLYGKPPEDYPLPEQGVDLGGATAQTLFLEYQRLAGRKRLNEMPVTHQVVRDLFTPANRREHIRARLADRGRIRFAELFERALRSEVPPTFVALLDMLAEGEIGVGQETAFADIFIFPKGEGGLG